MRKPHDEPLFQQFFGCELRFDAPANLLVLDAAALAEPFVTYNSELQALLVSGLEDALSANAEGRPLTEDVRGALRHNMSGERPTLENRQSARHERAHLAAPARRRRHDLSKPFG